MSPHCQNETTCDRNYWYSQGTAYGALFDLLSYLD
jgi:hypothetical protein